MKPNKQNKYHLSAGKSLTRVCKLLHYQLLTILHKSWSKEHPNFEGAPNFNFDLIGRINLDTEEQANDK